MFAKDDSEINCGDIARFFNDLYGMNGGGHLHAAGWSAPVNIFENTDIVHINIS